jgi:hypothetical protein
MCWLHSGHFISNLAELSPPEIAPSDPLIGPLVTRILMCSVIWPLLEFLSPSLMKVSPFTYLEDLSLLRMSSDDFLRDSLKIMICQKGSIEVKSIF